MIVKLDLTKADLYLLDYALRRLAYGRGIPKLTMIHAENLLRLIATELEAAK